MKSEGICDKCKRWMLPVRRRRKQFYGGGQFLVVTIRCPKCWREKTVYFDEPRII